MELFIYLPTSKYESFYAIPRVYWYEDNSLGEEPPEYVKQQIQLYDQISECTDPEGIELLLDQILVIAEEQFYMMGISLSLDQYMLVKQNFHNVPQIMPFSWVYPTPAPTNPCQYFIDSQD